MDAAEPIDRHGFPQRLRRIWSGMRQRCGHTKTNRPNNLTNYVGRGITVCDEWRGSFATFATWAMANGYAADLTIDRRDNDRGYAPSNCRWVSIGENIRNRRVTRLNPPLVREIKQRLAAGEKYNLIAEAYGLSWGSISSIARGKQWSDVPWPEGFKPVTRRPELLIKTNPAAARGRTCNKLSFEQVLDIKRRIAAGEMMAPIAECYGVSRVTISEINSGRTWPDVEWPEGYQPIDRRKTGAPRPWRRRTRG